MNKTINSERLQGKEFFERMKTLSGIPIKEEKSTEKKQINEGLIYKPELIKDSIIKGADGKNYSIIRENHKYFIKVGTGTKSKEQLDESDFVFIGGLSNKLYRRYDSLGESQKQLNFLMKNLSESFNRSFLINERSRLEEKEVKEVKPGKDIKEELGDNEKEEEPEEESPVSEPGDGLQEPASDVSSEPSPDAGIEGGDVTAQEPVASAEPEVGGLESPDGGSEVSPPEAGLEEPAPESGLEEPAPELDGDDEDLEGGLEDDGLGDENPVEIIQSLVGKLSQKVRTTELTPELTKSVLNSLISSLNLREVDPEERLEIARKVKRGGTPKKEMELQEDFGDKIKGTQPMGKGKIKDIAGGGTTEKKKGEFGKSAKGTQAMGKGKLKAEGIDRIGQIVLESLRKHKRFSTPPVQKRPVINERKEFFTSKREDLKSVENLIESIVKKKSNQTTRKLKENFAYEDNLYHKKDKLDEFGTGIAPNEAIPLIEFIITTLVPILGTGAGLSWLFSDEISKVKQKIVGFLQKLGKKDSAATLQNMPDEALKQAINTAKQSQRVK